MSVRILISGSDKVYAIENFYVRYMMEAGANVKLFPANSMFHDYYYKYLFNKLIFRVGLSSIYKKINKEFLLVVEEFKPDVVWVFKGMELFPGTLNYLKSKGLLLANYNPDNPFLFSGKGSGNRNISESLAFYDLHFAYSAEIKRQIEKQYQINTVMLPFGFDISNEIYEICVLEQEIVKACFMGNPDKERVAFLLQLADEGIQLDVYGNFWDRYITHPNVKTFPPVYENEMWKCLARYRVQLNMMRVHNLTSHNMRSFEVPAIGGILLAPDTEDHRSFFDEGKEIFIYKNAESCVEQIRYILSLSYSAAQEIRKSARHRSLQSGYSYRSRSLEVLNKFKQMAEAKGKSNLAHITE